MSSTIDPSTGPGQGWGVAPADPAPPVHVPTAQAPAPYPPVPGGPYQAPAAGLQMKRRNPVAVWIGLPLITLGVYSLVWYYKIHKEMAEYDRRRAISPAGPLLVLLFLGWTVVAYFITFANTAGRIRNAQRAAGLAPTCSTGITILLMFVFGLHTLYLQTELNKVVDVHPGAALGTQVPLAG